MINKKSGAKLRLKLEKGKIEISIEFPSNSTIISWLTLAMTAGLPSALYL